MDSYLDDRMEPSEKEVFADRLACDAGLRADYERQRAIDASLQRVYRGAHLDQLLERVEMAIGGEIGETQPFNPSQRGWRVFAAAALLALSLVGVWYSWSMTRPPPVVDVYAKQPWRGFATVYYDTIRDGFKPAWICRTEQQFERTFSRRFRQPLLLAKLPSGMTAGGISYSNTLSEATINVLGRVDGTPVMIFVDRVDVDHAPLPPPPPELRIFKRQLDDLVLYELTPLDRPNILPYFYNPHKN